MKILHPESSLGWAGQEIRATLRSGTGHRYLVEEVPLLTHRDAQLQILGAGPQREALQQQIVALDLRDRVRMVEHQSDVAPWLAALDVFVLPSYADEGVLQALVQAMVVGTPCVTTDAGAIGEVALADHTALVDAKETSIALVAAKFGLSSLLDCMEAVFRRAIAARQGGA